MFSKGSLKWMHSRIHSSEEKPMQFTLKDGATVDAALEAQIQKDLAGYAGRGIAIEEVVVLPWGDYIIYPEGSR